MYKVIDNPKMMSKDEIEKEFDGKWVYIVKAEFAIGKQLIKGLPVIIADSPFEGQDDGIYEKYRTPEYDSRYARDLCHYKTSIPTVFAMDTELKRRVAEIEDGIANLVYHDLIEV